MARKTSFLYFLFISLSLHLPGESLSLPTTTEFDVSASLLHTLHFISSHPDSVPESQQIAKIPQQQEDALASSSFSLSLHPRASLHKFNDYKALTQSRLARDSARVDSIWSTIEAALVNATTPSVYKTKDLETPLTSGAGQGSGEYFARLAVGQPPEEYYFVADTGSDVSWLQCAPCADCYQQSDPIFVPDGSSTYRSVSCDSPRCSQLHSSDCQDGSCMYQISYGDGSFTMGNLATEKLTFGNSGSVNDVAVGCGHDNEGLFTGAAGLLGLGRGSLSLPSQLKATSFSYCLVNRDSSESSTLEFNSAQPEDSITASLIHNPRAGTYLYVDFSGFLVGGRRVDIPTSTFAVDEAGRGGVIVDSGTAVTRLKTKAYTALRDSFRGMARNLPPTDEYELFDTCYDLSGRQTASVPSVGFILGGRKVLQLPPENYLIPVDTDGKYCFAFAPTDVTVSIIGNVQQQGTRVTYDLANSVIGFSPKKC